MKKVSKQQTIDVLNELRNVEEEIARQLESPDGADIDQTFNLIKSRLQERYRLLSGQSKGASFAEILREVDNLKHAAQTNDPNLLKQVHTRASKLKIDVLYPPTPPKINIDAILAAIDHIGVESDSDTEVAAPQPHYNTPSTAPLVAPQPHYNTPRSAPLAAPPLFNRELPEPTTARPHLTDQGDLPFSRPRQSSQGSERQRSSDNERGAGRIAEFNRHINVDTEEPRARQVEHDTRSQASYHSATVESSRRQETASLSLKQNDMLSPADLLGPGAFSHPKTIELTDTSLTPDRKSQPRVDDSRHSTNVSKTPIKEEPRSPVYEPRPQERSAPGPQERSAPGPQERSAPGPQERSAPGPQERPAPGPQERSAPGQGPKIEDICKNATIRRYFTAMTDFVNPTVDNWCVIEELYNPTQFFVKSLSVDRARDEIQTKVYNEIKTRLHTMRKTKSHTLGKLVLCCYSYDDMWYRGCIIQTHQDNRYTVLFVDYGNKETISYERLRDMTDELMYMAPMCVQQCYLQGIVPPGGAESWDPVTTEALWDLVSDRELKIIVQNSQNQVYGVVLKVNEGRTTVNINEKLIEIGLAAPLQDDTSEVMKGLCTSPTRFAPPTAFQNTAPPPARKTRNRSPTSTRRPLQRGPSPPPASTRRPLQRGPSPPPASTRRPLQRVPSPPPVSTSDSEEESSVGRPPSFGNGSSHKPLSRQINSPPGSFGDNSAKGRGNVFGNAAAGRGSLRDVEFRLG